MYGLTTTLFFFFFFFLILFLLFFLVYLPVPPPHPTTLLSRLKRIVGNIGRGRSRTIVENFSRSLSSLSFFSSSLFLFYLDENLRRPNIYIRKMICLIVRGREISRSYHFYFDVPCNLVEHRKKNSVVAC